MWVDFQLQQAFYPCILRFLLQLLMGGVIHSKKREVLYTFFDKSSSEADGTAVAACWSMLCVPSPAEVIGGTVDGECAGNSHIQKLSIPSADCCPTHCRSNLLPSTVANPSSSSARKHGKRSVKSFFLLAVVWPTAREEIGGGWEDRKPPEDSCSCRGNMDARICETGTAEVAAVGVW